MHPFYLSLLAQKAKWGPMLTGLLVEQACVLGIGSGMHLSQQGRHVPAAGGGQCCRNSHSSVPGLQGACAAVDLARPVPDSQCCRPGVRALLQGVLTLLFTSTQ